MSKVVALYLRVSTQDQNVESQSRTLVDWCEKQGIFNYEMFTDHGISGAKESRPALNQLMERCERGDIEQVIVFSFSRFARSVSHLLKALQKFKDKGIRFHSITEALDTNSPMGMALFTLTGESIPAKNLEGKISFGLTLDPSYFGSTRLEVPDECES